VLDVISKGAAQSWQMENRGKTMIGDKFDFGFAVDWMRKDLSICLAEARRNGAHAAGHRGRRPALRPGAGARRRTVGHVEPHPLAQPSEVAMRIAQIRALLLSARARGSGRRQPDVT
jgi:hypothetical protein